MIDSSTDVSAPAQPSRAIASRDVPFRDVPSRDVSSRGVLSRGIPSRRTVVAAAAWSVPVVVATAALPAAAAASGTTLSFSASSYQAAACASITNASVRAESAGAGVGGVAITLQVSAGYTFAGGATSTVVTTGSDGNAACGDITVPASGAAGTISATAAGSTSTTAALSATPAHLLVFSPRGTTAVTGVPAAATPVAGEFFLADQTLYRHGIGAVQTSVVAVGALGEAPAKNGAFLLPLRLADGSAAVFDTAAGAATVVPGTPAGATPVAADLFLSGTTLYRGGVAVASDVAAYGQLLEHEQGSGPTGQFELPFRASDGTPRLYRSPSDEVRTAYEFGRAGGPPAGAVPLAGDLFSSGDAIYRVSWDGANPYGTGVIATGVQTWGTLTPNPYFSGQRLLPIRTTGGDAALVFVSTGRVRTVAQVPSGATPIAADLFLSGHTLSRADVGTVASDIGLVGQAVPTAAGASRVVVPATAVAPQC